MRHEGRHEEGRRPTAVVVAHPDDEILWLSSVLADADRVVFCFGDPFGRPAKAAARRRAVAALPLPSLVDLRIPESGAGFAVDRANPAATPFGLAIRDADARGRYEANFPRLVAALRPVLEGCAEVYTHNPWGEYGHAEHVQVHRAVAALQAELGFRLWFSNYVDAASWPFACRLAGDPCWSERRAARPDVATARRLRAVYRRQGAWTWTPFHRWPVEETLYGHAPAESSGRSLAGEVLLDVAGLRWWPPPWRPARRRLPDRPA
ncbi:PIG-L family deacetylase [Nitrospirillum pindoramense]|uniref:GlcNAc-PI de-N-acetylase n=1 Tax=Nitrospirillum amazonense TaxID=28077 RepID=A0A560H5N9_9PROT|nr:PIG-L family deacetylase [Nitrospirillum amazonense]TWB41129.1 GlcNAc-PI de-N-acetylase [Nitrospirillum amazonense]